MNVLRYWVNCQIKSWIWFGISSTLNWSIRALQLCKLKTLCSFEAGFLHTIKASSCWNRPWVVIWCSPLIYSTQLIYLLLWLVMKYWGISSWRAKLWYFSHCSPLIWQVVGSENSLKTEKQKSDNVFFLCFNFGGELCQNCNVTCFGEV